MRIDRVYTKAGDKGETSLIGGERVSKADPRLECYGTIDEVNAVIGLVIEALAQSAAGEHLLAAHVRLQMCDFSPDVSQALRGYLKLKLPEYMIPSVIAVVDEWPKTPSGKIDRKAIAAAPIEATALRGRAAVRAPTTPKPRARASTLSRSPSSARKPSATFGNTSPSWPRPRRSSPATR